MGPWIFTAIIEKKQVLNYVQKDIAAKTHSFRLEGSE